MEKLVLRKRLSSEERCSATWGGLDVGGLQVRRADVGNNGLVWLLGMRRWHRMVVSENLGTVTEAGISDDLEI